MRPRKQQRHLPPCVYQKHGAYYLVRKNKWIRLGVELGEALAEYARLQSTKTISNGMASFIEEALPTILAGRAEATRKQYTHCARKLQDILAEFSPEQVTQRDVVQIRRSLAETPGLANRMITVLKLIFDHALDEQIVDSNPVIGVKRLAQTARTRRITVEELEAIRATASPLLRAVIDLCVASGQRIGDVCKIARTDITDDGIFIEQQKTKSRLTLGWTAELRQAVADARALHGNVVHPYLFGQKPLAYHRAQAQWERACKRAGVENAVLHDLRAMAATEADAQGFSAQKLLGHTDARVTQRYLRDKIVPTVTGPSIRQKAKY